MTQLVHVRLPKELYDQVTALTRPAGFSSSQEFIRDAVRKNVESYRKEVLIDGLRSLQGYRSGEVSVLSKDDYELLFEKLKSASSSELLRKYNLEGVPIAKVRNVSRSKK